MFNLIHYEFLYIYKTLRMRYIIGVSLLIKIKLTVNKLCKHSNSI